MKKVLSLLLVLCLVVGMVPLAASAAVQTVKTFSELKNAVASAETGSTISVSGEIDFGTETLTIDRGLSIVGEPGSSLKFGGNANTAAFKVTTNEHVNLTNIALTTTRRAMVLSGNSPHVTVTGCTFLVGERGISFAQDGYAENAELILDSTIIRCTASAKTEDEYNTKTAIGDYRGISIFDVQDSQITLRNHSELSGFGYAINVAGTSDENGVKDTHGLVVTVEDSLIRSWTAFNVWGSMSTYNVTRSTILGINNSDGPSDGFAAIVFNDDLYDQFEGDHAYKNILNITDSTIQNYQSGTASENLVRIDCGVDEVNLQGTVTFNDTTGRNQAVFDISSMNDPLAFVERHADIANGVTVNIPAGNPLLPTFEVKNTYGDGQVSYGESFKEFISGVDYEGAAANKETVILLTNVNEPDFTVSSEPGHGNHHGGWTLDLAGHTLTLAGWEGDKITVIDSSADRSGDIIVDGKSILVARDGEKCYTSLAAAIDDAPDGATIKLLRDTSEARINIGKNIIIDLGTHTWTGTSEDCVFTVPGNHNVTIKNGSIVAPNLLGQVSGGNTIFEACSVTESDCLIVKGGTVLLKDTDITATAANAAGVQVNNGTFTLDADSSITAMGKEHAIGVFVQGTDESANPVVNIAGTITTYGSAVQGNGSDRSNPEINIQAGATLTSEKLAMYLPQPGTVNITGATVTGNAAIGIKSGTLNITDSVVHGKANDDVLGDEHSNTNGIAYDGSAIVIDSYIGYAGEMNLTISGESQIISDYSTAIHEIGNTAGATNVVSIQVNGGYFSSAANHEDILVRDVTKKTVTVSSGYFTSDPSQYLEEGKAAVESDKAGYNYMVTDATKTPAEVVPAAPDANVNPDLTEENQKVAKQIQKDLTSEVVAGDGVTAAANSVANQNTVTASGDVVKELNEAIGESGTEATAENTKIVIQPYMEITIEDVDVQDQTVTLDITPMYRTVATTADLEKDEIVLEKTDDDTAVNAVQIGEEKPLTITKPVTMTLKLPEIFKNTTVYIQHKWYEYSTTADDQGEITFTNPHGFSSFTFSTATQAAAKIDGTTYTSLQDAVNHVENGQTIILLKDGTATVNREVSFTIANENSNTFKATLTPGSDYTMTEGQNGLYTFTKKSSTPITPGPGDEDEFPFTDVKTSDWYYNAVKYVYENELMAGTSETTFEPNTKLNRAMAVQILYNLEGKPAVTASSTFTDAAAAGEWALDAITWAQQTGVVAGVGDNLFAPAAQVTREQFAQMMYNYAKYKGYDLTADGDLTQFSDSSKLQSWAVTAMKWANGNGLINGFEDDTLQPAGTTIRGQAASIIMNFDKNVVK